MLLKAALLLSVVGYGQACNSAIINAIFASLYNPPTTMAPTTTMPPTTTMAPTTTGGGGSNCTCGQANKVAKIVNGVETEAHEYPWQVGLTSGEGWTPFCGGSIISETSILTAAHCTAGKSPGDIVILYAEHDTFDAADGTYATVCAINDHADYDDSTLEYDYSVLTLCSPITYSEKASPVCLPPSGDGTQYEDLTHTVTGWGTTSSGGSISNVLLEVDVTSMSNTKCCTDYSYSCSSITDVMMCAADSGKDSCQGDSGGPLVTALTSGSYVQTGVVSFGIGCADPDYPGVYARVTKVMDWIQSVDTGSNCMI